jgi:hypothetical protein
MNYACVDPDRAISHFERAMRLSPRDPEISFVLSARPRTSAPSCFRQRCDGSTSPATTIRRETARWRG